MPSFNFLPVNGNKAKRNAKKSYKSNILIKNVIGIVWIDRKAEYYVLVNNVDKYYIHSSCYSCVGKSQLYRQGNFDKSNLVYIRLYDNLVECDRYCWLPFGVGCIVKGNVILENNIKYFIIKHCDIALDNKPSHEAMEFYLNNIEEINKLIISKRNEDR